jgi:hypothetical protein
MAMAHLLKHPLPHLNVALLIAIVWVALALADAAYDVGRMLEAW